MNVAEPGQKPSSAIAGDRPDGNQPFDLPEKNVRPPWTATTLDDENHPFVHRSQR
jgi:hypothetical protein